MIVPKFAKYIFRILIVLLIAYGLILVNKEISGNYDASSLNSDILNIDNTSTSDSTARYSKENHKQQKISFGDKTYTVYISDTEESRESGLSGWKELTSDEAMIFVFDKEGEYPFWMKDMLFPIDIVWLDSSFKPVHIEKNVSPDTYPKKFVNSISARYVLELRSGTVDMISK